MKRKDVLSKVRDFFSSVEIVLSDDLIFNDQVRSYAAVDDKPGKKSAWGVLDTHKKALILGSHRTGKKHRLDLSEKEIALLQSNSKATLVSSASKQASKDRQQMFVARNSQRYIKRLKSAAGAYHQYAAKKGIALHPDTYLDEDKIVIPMYFQGEICSYQTIDENGAKRFKKGGRSKGCYHQIGEITEQAYIAEGYATGATIYEETGCCVFICFTANNILSVTEYLVKFFPKVRFRIAADNDHLTQGNPGLSKAREVSQCTGVPYTYPKFPEGYCGTDFNDLAVLNRELGGDYDE